MGTRSEIDWKVAILDTKGPDHQALQTSWSSCAYVSRSPSSLEEGSDSLDSDSDSGDHWAEVRKQAAQEGAWDIAGKLQILAAPVIFKRGKNTKWESIPYRELTELCKACKNNGRKSPYFKNFLQEIFSAHVLVPHDLWHVMSLLLSPMELLLWESILKNN